ncbi:extracellular solute-binding protein [Desulfobacula toluolica]|uniref:ABC-type oligopeptide transporter, periplasmic binding protein n=1 Tax=Desulfobacula toluolica (strain DSM 7467 / Tol2) TaxID=651182 RepID=K0NPG4_DESTT|nr:extracellular solute-binding protein [Desulfobacula toluolica]CCK80737.1 ABC-type oligopeptide transporter, periplasmic binding protein [Desulfobacula toluolica Tol2]
MKKTIIMLIILWMTGICPADEASIISTDFSLRDTPKYGQGFTHFDYVNPNAPKGGSVTLSTTGTFDSFNRYAQRGDAAAGSEQLYDTLMTPSDDEIDVLYPLIAEKIEYSKDYTWIIFTINKNARFQDKKPITSADVVFTFNTFMTQGVPQFKSYYKNVSHVEALDTHRVKFTLKKSRLELLHSLAGLAILPKHYWETRDFSAPTTDVPLGSSGFTIDTYKMGQYVVIKRLKDYWAKDLPVNKGRHNFDLIRYDYYKDEIVTLEAFKAGEFDFRMENVAKQWATMYKGDYFDQHHIIKEEIAHDIPQAMQALIFNTQKEVFKDVRVREALTYAMDFEWMNQHLFYNQYTRTRSFFQNTEYQAKGLPSKDEIACLEPVKDKIPPRVYTSEYQPPVTDGSGNIRSQLRTALGILKKAGWQISNRKMTHQKTGQLMEFELLLYSPTMERIAIPFQDNLKKLGITLNIRRVDTTQFINRMRARDFDMITGQYAANPFPSSNLKIVWHSNFFDSTYNTAGVQDPAIDFLTEKIDQNQTDKTALLHYGRALDRVLQYNFFVIPEWHLSKFRVAYWNKFSRPAVRPRYAIGFIDTWWIDKAKQAALPNRNITQ